MTSREPAPTGPAPCTILVGITGGIAAYKTADLVSKLVQADFNVHVVMTEAATRFVGIPTFQALTGNPVATELFDTARYPLGAHIELAGLADLLVVAPASADYLASVASGRADNLLTTLTLAYPGPLLLAPAMNADMWAKPAVQRNVATVQADGAHLVGPEQGWLSCRRQGAGRMAESTDILAAIRAQLASSS